MKKVISTTIDGATIDGATYKEYNANNRGNNSPDCVKRAISMAFNMDYNQVSKLLLAKAKEKRKQQWNILQVYEPVIYDLGGARGQEPDGIYKVDEFIDAFVQEGACIIETNKKPTTYGKGDHLTCAINGVLYDSWDSSNEYVVQFYMIDNTTHEFTDIEDHIEELIPEGGALIQQLGEKYKDKYELTGEFIMLGKGLPLTNFSFYYDLRYKDEKSTEVFDITVVLSPTMTLEAARKKMIETIKIRMYDRFYTINQKVKKRSEGETLFQESGYTDADKRNLYLDGREKRFYNSLPDWFKPFVIYLNVQDPGQYSDSYEITALPIKGDPDRRNVEFYGYESSHVKDEIERYRKNFERVDDDYSYYEEY